MKANTLLSPVDPPALLTVDEACKALRVSRWTLYRLIHDGQLVTVQIGSRRLIPVSAINELVLGLSHLRAER